jgi:hypothetical protein
LPESDSEDSINSDNDNEYPLLDIKDIKLTSIKAQIVKNNLKVHEQIAKKGAKAITFLRGDLVTLKIPPKLRLVGELLRLLVHIIKVVRSR